MEKIKASNRFNRYQYEVRLLRELICPDDVVVYVVHSFNTLNASSTLE